MYEESVIALTTVTNLGSARTVERLAGLVPRGTADERTDCELCKATADVLLCCPHCSAPLPWSPVALVGSYCQPQ